MEQDSFSVETDPEFSDIFSKTIEKALKIKEKQDAELQLAQDDAKALEKLLQSLSGQADEESLAKMLSVQEKCASLMAENEKLSIERESMRKHVQDAGQEVETLKQLRHKQQSQAVHPKARYSVNVFRDISKINWHEDSEPNELKGFVCSKTGLKTFCFNTEKQSNFFIANSLWEMGEDESRTETADRQGGQTNLC